MSQENVEMVRRGYDAYNRGDPEGMVADFAPTFEWSTTATPISPLRLRGGFRSARCGSMTLRVPPIRLRLRDLARITAGSCHLVTTLADQAGRHWPSHHRNRRLSGQFCHAGGRTRTCDTRIMIPLL